MEYTKLGRTNTTVSKICLGTMHFGPKADEEESFKIMDDELAESISKQALVTAQTENELANLQGKTEIATAEQHRVS